MKSIKEINTDTKEGQLLLMAIASLTGSPSVCVGRKVLKGTSTTPDKMLREINKVAKKVYA